MSTRLPRLSAFLVILLLVIFASAQQNLRQPLIRQPIDESRVVTLKGNTHPLAKRQFDMGMAPPDLPMDRMLLVLKRDPQQDYALHALLDDQQDKNSPNYHKWMTPATFGAQFGASDQDIQLVTGWLQTHGFQINHVSNGRSVIEFSGVESAGRTGIPYTNSQLHAGEWRAALGQCQRSENPGGISAGGGGGVEPA